MHIKELCEHMEVEITGTDLYGKDGILLPQFPCSWSWNRSTLLSWLPCSWSWKSCKWSGNGFLLYSYYLKKWGRRGRLFGIVAYEVGTIREGCLFQEIWYILKPTHVTVWGQSKGIAIVQYFLVLTTLLL